MNWSRFSKPCDDRSDEEDKHGDDDLISVAMNPLTGKVRLTPGEVEVPKQ